MQRLSLSTSHPRYDPGSGQVYSERTVTPYLRARRQWASKLVLERPSRAHLPGAPSLEDIAVRECLTNLRNFTSESFKYVPVHLAQRMYKEAEDLGLDTREVWQAFASTYKEMWPSYHASANINPLCSFPEYITSLTSDTFHWMTALTLSAVQLPRAELMGLSAMKNLIGLEISGHNALTRRLAPTESDEDAALVDDSVIRAWSRHVSEIGAFPKLRVIIVRNQPGITSRVFEYLNEFPSLNLLGVRSCHIDEQEGEKSARIVGWTSEDNDERFISSLKNEIALAHAWDGPMRSCIDRSVALSSNQVSSPRQTASSSSSAPLVNFRLGATSSDVLFNTPTVFYRNQKSKTTLKHRISFHLEERTIKDSTTTSGNVGNKIEQSDVQSDSEHIAGTAKRRKVRPQKQKSTGILDDFMSEMTATDLKKDRSFEPDA